MYGNKLDAVANLRDERGGRSAQLCCVIEAAYVIMTPKSLKRH